MNNTDQSSTPPAPSTPPSAVAPPESGSGPGWERKMIEDLLLANLKERRARRRWSIFMRLSTLAVVVFAIMVLGGFEFPDTDMEGVGQHTALVDLDGFIDSEGPGSAAAVVPALNRAFSDRNSTAVVLRINSPGGSPVQAGMINDEISRLRKLHPGKPLYVVVDEMCASAGYYIAASADRIYVNRASVVGSIGVLMDGFGFQGLMGKIGVERRLLTAGEHKGILDPFSPLGDKHRALAQSMLDEVHQQFIDAVRAGRGKRLKEGPDTFSGLYWSGAKAVEMGLADGLGTVDSVARDVVKAEDVVEYTEREGLPERVMKKFGASVGAGMAKAAWHGLRPAMR